MEMYLGYLSRPCYGTVSYIRTMTPGLVAGCRVGYISLKHFVNIFNIFINYLETWSKVCNNRFGLFVVVIVFLFSCLINRYARSYPIYGK